MVFSVKKLEKHWFKTTVTENKQPVSPIQEWNTRKSKTQLKMLPYDQLLNYFHSENKFFLVKCAIFIFCFYLQILLKLFFQTSEHPNFTSNRSNLICLLLFTYCISEFLLDFNTWAKKMTEKLQLKYHRWCRRSLNLHRLSLVFRKLTNCKLCIIIFF